MVTLTIRSSAQAGEACGERRVVKNQSHWSDTGNRWVVRSRLLEEML